jgi:hypothetical protein
LRRDKYAFLHENSVGLCQLISSSLPGFDPTFEDLGILKAHLDVFGRLTDSRSIVRSGAVKDDFFVFGQRSELGFKGAQRNSPFQMDGFEFLIAVVGAY